MKDNFNQSLAYVLQNEGLWSDNPKDPGGATMKGITFAVFKNFKNNPNLTKQDLLHINDQDVHDIYKQLYWDKIRGDDLPCGVDYAVFDAAVNMGVNRAAKLLQESVGVNPDGVIGNITLGVINKTNKLSLLENFAAEKKQFYQSLSTFNTFGKGWLNRVAEVKTRSENMLV